VSRGAELRLPNFYNGLTMDGLVGRKFVGSFDEAIRGYLISFGKDIPIFGDLLRSYTGGKYDLKKEFNKGRDIGFAAGNLMTSRDAGNLAWGLAGDGKYPDGILKWGAGANNSGIIDSFKKPLYGEDPQSATMSHYGMERAKLSDFGLKSNKRE
jgi:hypothetical protein